MERLVHQVLSGAESFRFDSRAIISNKIILLARVVPESLLDFAHEHAASVEAKIRRHNFWHEVIGGLNAIVLDEAKEDVGGFLLDEIVVENLAELLMARVVVDDSGHLVSLRRSSSADSARLFVARLYEGQSPIMVRVEHWTEHGQC